MPDPLQSSSELQKSLSKLQDKFNNSPFPDANKMLTVNEDDLVALIDVHTKQEARKSNKALLLAISKGDPQNPLVYSARIEQELKRIEMEEE